MGRARRVEGWVVGGAGHHGCCDGGGGGGGSGDVAETLTHETPPEIPTTVLIFEIRCDISFSDCSNEIPGSAAEP